MHSRRADSFIWASGGIVLLASLAILGLVATTLVLSFASSASTTVAAPSGAITGGFTLANYRMVLSDPLTLRIVLNSLVFATVTLVVALGFGLPIAWLVECTDLKGRKGIAAAMLIGLLIPTFAGAAGWLFLLHPRIGLINVALKSLLNLSDAPFDIVSLIGMGWVEGLSRAPIAFLMVSAALRAMDRSLEEAALTAGAPPLSVLRRVMLPLIRPSLISTAIYIFMIGFGSFDVPAIIGWGNRIFTFGTYIYLLTNPQDVFPGYGQPAALGSLLLVAALVPVWWARRSMASSHRYAVVTGKAYRPRLTRLGRLQGAGWFFAGLYFTVSLLLPLLVLGWASLLPFLQLPSARAFAVASLNNYRTMPWDLFLTGFRHTVIIALVTPPLVLIASFCFSWLGFRSRLRGRSLLDAIAFAPHAIPHVVLAMGLLLVALYVIQPILPIYGTVGALIFAFTIGWLSYGSRVTNIGVLQLSKELEEGAQVSGASSWGVVFRIVLPLMSRGLMLAWIYIAILCTRELTLSVLLSTPGNMTLPVVIWSMWLSGGLGRAAAALVCFLLCMLPLVVIYLFSMRPLGRRRARSLPAGPATGVAIEGVS